MKLILVLQFILLAHTFAWKCVTPRRTTPETCLNPPVVRRVSLPAYTGRWFNLFVSGSSTEFAFDCVTANYSLNADKTVNVLNCFYGRGFERPRCLPGLVTRRAGLPTSQLQVSFGPMDTAAGNYNVAVLLGRKNYGYFAAAVYACELVDGVPREGFFIIGRTPFAPRFVLTKIKERLRCMGYSLRDEFVKIEHRKTCKYFDGGLGFDTIGLGTFGGRPAP